MTKTCKSVLTDRLAKVEANYEALVLQSAGVLELMVKTAETKNAETIWTLSVLKDVRGRLKRLEAKEELE